MNTLRTPKEISVFNAIIDGLYAEPGYSDLDAADVAHAVNMTEQATGGVLTSLIEKGVIWVEPTDVNGTNYNFIHLTSFAYHPEWAELEGLDYIDVRDAADDTGKHAHVNYADFKSFELEACKLEGEGVTVIYDDDDDAADFFTVYGRMDNGQAVALIDCMTRTDAETAVQLLTQAGA